MRAADTKNGSTPLFNIGVLPSIWGIYIAQGVLGGLTFAGLPTILRSQHVSLGKIGLLSLVMLIWAIKFLWAQPVERLRIAPTGRRHSRKIILMGECVTAGLLCVITFWSPQLSSGLLGLLLCAAVSATIVDIACDAFLIEQIPENEREKGNMAQVGGAYIGLVLGGSVFVSLYGVLGWRIGCFVMAFIVLSLTAPMLFYNQENREVFPVNPQELRPGLLNALRRGEIWCGIVLTIMYEMSGRLVQGLTGPFLIDQGISLNAVGIFNGIGGVVSGLCGTIAGGMMVSRAGAKNAMYMIAICHAVLLAVIFSSIKLHFLSTPILFSLFVCEATLVASSFVASYSRLMILTSPYQPGIDFTLFQSASAIVAALLGVTGSVMAGKIGYDKVFLLSVLLSIATIVLIPLINYFMRKYNYK
ncbi:MULTISPECIES: MFS transporter [Acetobacter]|uniref:MFS transporter n=1 Tax=Acetobacter TaxID=434 RepID=UPI0039E986E6